jgi:hypothetical protein
VSVHVAAAVVHDPTRPPLAMRGLRPLSATARLAMEVAARVAPDDPGERDAVVLGSAWASVGPLADFVQVAAEQGDDAVFPMAFPNTVVSVHVGYVATLLGLTGPAVSVCGRYAGLEAIAQAAALIEAGRADRVLALEADAAEPTVVAADPSAVPGAAALLLSRSPCGALAELDVRPDEPLVADAACARQVAVAALAVARDGRGRSLAGPSGARGGVRVELRPPAAT